MNLSRILILSALLLGVILPPGTPRGAGLPAQADAQPRPPLVSDYHIRVVLDVEAKTLEAHETITYTNSTDVEIPDLVFHLYLNAFRSADSVFLREAGPSHRGIPWDPQHTGWIEVTGIRLVGGPPLSFAEIEDGTLGRAVLPEPVPPGAAVTVEVDFRAQLPRVFARTGYAGDFFMVGQWFPKLGVWQAGAWNAYPFHANAEFYADFGAYEVEITLPAEYVTGGTGMLADVEARAGGMQTVTYQAERVIDFAWTASPHFQEAKRQVNGVEILYLYLPEHAWTVERVLTAAERAIGAYGRWYGPYAYPRLTIVDVPDDGKGAGGMEYPTLITAGAIDMLGLGPAFMRLGFDRSIELVVMHEIGHQWWYAMVATNEAEEPWLDEGFTDYSTVRLMGELYGAQASALDACGLEAGYLDLRRAEYLANPEVPMFGRAWDFSMIEYSVATYSKPALSLATLERVLGEEKMLEVMATYFRRYQYRHPTTEDFRVVAEEVAGQDLAWFFEGLVYGKEVLNYRVTSLGAHSVTVARQGDLRVPTEVEVVFVDGSSIREPWDGGEAEKTIEFPNHPAVERAKIDPERKILVDLVWSDNGLSRQRDLAAWLALVTRLIFRLQDFYLIVGGW